MTPGTAIFSSISIKKLIVIVTFVKKLQEMLIGPKPEEPN
jgi:hypothetical protein